jgi:hypothetical protein
MKAIASHAKQFVTEHLVNMAIALARLVATNYVNAQGFAMIHARDGGNSL